MDASLNENDQSPENLTDPIELEEGTSDNCFAVTLFCVDDGYDNRCGDFLEPAFELFPDREYCLLSLPHTSPEPALMSDFSLVLRTNYERLPLLYLCVFMFVVHTKPPSEVALMKDFNLSCEHKS